MKILPLILFSLLILPVFAYAQSNDTINEIHESIVTIDSTLSEIKNQINSLDSLLNSNSDQLITTNSELIKLENTINKLDKDQDSINSTIDEIFGKVNDATLGWVAWASAIGTIFAIIIAGLIFSVQHNQGQVIQRILNTIGGNVDEQSNLIKVRQEYFKNTVNASLPNIKRGLEQNTRYLNQFSDDPDDYDHNYYIDSEMVYIITNVLSDVETLTKMSNVTKGSVHPKSEENLVELCTEMKRWYAESSPYEVEVHWKFMHDKILNLIDEVLINRD